MTERTLRTTVIEKGDHFTPEMVIITGVEDYDGYSFMFSYATVELLGFSRVTPKTYLQGTYEGLKQTVNIELTPEAIDKIVDDFHNLNVTYFTAAKQKLGVSFLKAIMNK